MYSLPIPKELKQLQKDFQILESSLELKLMANKLNLGELEKLLILGNRLVSREVTMRKAVYVYNKNLTKYTFDKNSKTSIAAKSLYAFCLGISQDPQSTPQLSNELEKRITKQLFPLKIGTRGLYGQTIGACCEVHVSDSLLKQCTETSLDQIKFTRARRVRTNQIEPRCFNCRAVFGIESI